MCLHLHFSLSHMKKSDRKMNMASDILKEKTLNAYSLSLGIVSLSKPSVEKLHFEISSKLDQFTNR